MLVVGAVSAEDAVAISDSQNSLPLGNDVSDIAGAIDSSLITDDSKIASSYDAKDV